MFVWDCWKTGCTKNNDNQTILHHPGTRLMARGRPGVFGFEAHFHNVNGGGRTGSRDAERLIIRNPAIMAKLALAVAGAHLSGLGLNHQLVELGAKLIRTTRTAPVYSKFVPCSCPVGG